MLTGLFLVACTPGLVVQPEADLYFEYKTEEEFARSFAARENVLNNYITPVPDVYYRCVNLPDGSALQKISMWLGFGMDGFSYDLSYTTHHVNVYYKWYTDPHNLLQDVYYSFSEYKEFIKEFQHDGLTYYYINAGDWELPTTIFFSCDDIKFRVSVPSSVFDEEMIEKYCQIEKAAVQAGQ